MGRPTPPLGTHGKIGFTVEPGPPHRVRPDVLPRPRRRSPTNDEVRPVQGGSGARAEAGAARPRAARPVRHHGRDQSRNPPLSLLSELSSDRAANTRQAYSYALDNVIPTMGALRVREAGTPVIDRTIKTITSKAGPGAAKTARSVLSGMFRLAVRHGAVSTNPVREAAPTDKPRKSRVRALTRDEAEEMMSLLRSHPRALGLDLPDVVDSMLGTGVRIGEALAVRRGTNPDGEPLLDLDGGTVEINATIIRVKARGLIIQEWPKTDAGLRRLALPPYAVKIIESRDRDPRRKAPQGVVFGSPLGRLRDPSNIAGDLREVLDGIGCSSCGGRGRCRGAG